MQLVMKSMDETLATKILQWKYAFPHDFYNNEVTEEAMDEMLNGSYYAVFKQPDELFGFFCIGKSAQVPAGYGYGVYVDDFVDIGLGMNPKMVGQGNGYAFCSFFLRYIEEIYKGTPIRLTVAKFNERAIHVYEKLGFVRVAEFHSDITEFMTMVKNHTTNVGHTIYKPIGVGSTSDR